jgi:hypothetical protein
MSGTSRKDRSGSVSGPVLESPSSWRDGGETEAEEEAFDEVEDVEKEDAEDTVWRP